MHRQKKKQKKRKENRKKYNRIKRKRKKIGKISSPTSDKKEEQKKKQKFLPRLATLLNLPGVQARRRFFQPDFFGILNRIQIAVLVSKMESSRIWYNLYDYAYYRLSNIGNSFGLSAP